MTLSSAFELLTEKLKSFLNCELENVSCFDKTISMNNIDIGYISDFDDDEIQVCFYNYDLVDTEKLHDFFESLQSEELNIQFGQFARDDDFNVYIKVLPSVEERTEQFKEELKRLLEEYKDVAKDVLPTFLGIEK